MKKANNQNSNSEEKEKVKTSSFPDAFERREAVIESVKETFKSRIGRANCKSKHFVLWIDADAITFDDLSAPNITGLVLAEELTGSLFKIGYEVGSIEIKNGRPEGDVTRCNDHENLDVEMFLEKATQKRVVDGDSKKKGVVSKARIILASGSSGSLKQSEGYEIDSEKIPYNIGRAIESGDPIRRVNHIEIIDETRRVSRTQAHIGFSEKIGFYLQLDKNPQGTNGTKRIRRGIESELRSIQSLMTLQDGDYIELSGQVTLLFKLITND